MARFGYDESHEYVLAGSKGLTELIHQQILYSRVCLIGVQCTERPLSTLYPFPTPSVTSTFSCVSPKIVQEHCINPL